MTRKLGLVFIGAVLFGSAACDKPSEEDCRKAIANMRSIQGTEDPTVNADPDVRRCKGASNKKSVQCAIKATNLDQLKACGFDMTPKKKDGSAAPTGSADPGSAAPTGSAAPGSAAPTGSADAGSAAPTGSADAGSAAPGSAAPGSAAPGSAAPGSGSATK